MYFWQNRLRKKTPPFDAWLRKNPATIKQNYDHYFINDECIINHFIRFEHFQKDMMSLEKTKGMTGLWDTFRRINAKGGIRSKDATISATFDMHPEAVQVIEFFNKDLFDRFDYTAS